MPHTKNSRFNLAQFMKARKAAREKAVDENRKLSAELKKVQRAQEKLATVRDHLKDITNELENIPSQGQVPQARTRSPTALVNGESTLGPRTARKRRHETMEAAAKIHGSSNEHPSASFEGMFDTLQKRCKLDNLTEYVTENKPLTNRVVSKEYKKGVLEFEKSNDNIVRSIATYYASGVMGKRKYKSVRLALSMKSNEGKQGKRTSISICKGCKVPKLLTYSDLVEQLKKIDIGTVHEIDEDYLEGLSLETENKVNGAYRDLREYLPMLAKFYLSQNSKESLKGFAESTGTFQIALGGDGCPFGKNESACSFLVSFLNVGRRVASSYDNFLIFGANCDESSPVVKKYVQSLLPQIGELERAEYEFEGIKYRFKLEELPNDMKMLAMLAGELTISAKYFSPFANVSLDDCRDVKGTFGTESSNKWKPGRSISKCGG